MISPDLIQAKALRRYGFFLRAFIRGDNIFPFTIPADKSASTKFSDFDQELTALILQSKEKTGVGYSLRLKEKVMRHGKQQAIEEVYFESQEDYLWTIAKGKEFESFKGDFAMIVNAIPMLKEWAIENCAKVISYHGKWSDLIKVCLYFQRCPKPNLYIRELPTGTHTKFIEQNFGIIRDLLDQLIPGSLIDSESQFEKRFSLKFDEPKIRLIILDMALAEKYFAGISDITIGVSYFNSFSVPVKRVIVLENKTNFSNLMNFLTLPQMDSTIGIFGRGFGVDSLKNAQWLHDKEIIYWGDIDSHGFRILSQLRRTFRHVKSVMMDRVTFDRFFEGDSGTPDEEVLLDSLSDDERALYKWVTEGNRRLEQEKISHDYVLQEFNRLLADV